MPTALLLDLDGTLVDSIPCWIEAFRETLAEAGRPMSEEEFVRTIYQRTDPLSTVVEMLGIALPHLEFRARRDERYLALLGSRVAWLPGAEALLAGVDAPLGIVTNSWRRYVDAIDACLGVRARVGTVVDLEDAGDRAKPDAYPLVLAAERLGVAPADCVYVGDQAHDLSAARAAGMGAWLLRGPETPAEAPELADRVFDDLGAVRAAWPS